MSNSHATNLHMWDDVVATLTVDHRVLRYDQRGHGRTPATPAPYGFDGLADDLLAVMDAADIERAALLGISMGAVTVLRAAARQSSRVRAAVACDGQWRSPSGAAALWDQRVAQVRAEGTAALAGPTVARWFRPGFAERSPELAMAVERMIGTTSIEGYAGCAQAMRHYDFSADAARLDMPVMFVVGRHDGTLPTVMREMTNATPGAALIEIDDAGHLPAIEQPAVFLDAVLPFLATAPR